MLAPVTKKKDPVPVDFDLLLKEIHAKIGEIVLTKVDASTEVSGKEPIQLLYVSFHFFTDGLTGYRVQSNRSSAAVIPIRRKRLHSAKEQGKDLTQQIQRRKTEEITE